MAARQGKSFWDDEDIKQAATGGEYVKFLAVGDAVTGTVAKIGKKMFGDQAAIEIVLTDGQIITAGQVALVRALYELRPAKDDDITIEFVATYKAANGTGKLFRVEVATGDEDPRVIDQSEDDDRQTRREEPEPEEPPKRERRASSNGGSRTRAKAGAAAGGSDEPPY